MLESIPNSATIVARESVVFCDLKDGVALLDLDQSLYFSLNPVAAVVWNNIQSPTPIPAIILAVEREFDVGAADIRSDIMALVNELMSKDLIRVHE
jgi:hypothetical protein